MAGDTDNITVWSDADVVVGTITSAIPAAGAAYGVGWDFVGILEGSAGFSESQTFDSTDFNGWGKGVIASSKRNQAITKTFTVLEDNEATQSLRYDTSGMTYTSPNYTGTLKARDLNQKLRLGFDRMSGTLLKREVTANYAMIESIGDVTEGEDGILSFSVTVKVYPDADGVYWDVFKGTPV